MTTEMKIVRKRDRDRLSKQLNDAVADLDYYVQQQLHGSAWYFENNADGKGYSFAAGVIQSLEVIRQRICDALADQLERDGADRAEVKDWRDGLTSLKE
jgi:hypothetical protein